MKYTFYIDSFLLYQTAINLCVMDIVEKGLEKSSKWKRKIICSFGIAVLSCAGILIPFGQFYIRMLFVYVVSACLLVAVAYPWMKGQERLRMMCFTFGIFFLVGSIIVFVQNLFPSITWLQNGFGGVIFLVYMIRGVYFLWKKTVPVENRKDRLIDVFLCVGDYENRLKALCDSGNCLRLAGSGKPVTIIEKSAFMKLMGYETMEDMPKEQGRIVFHGLGEKEGELPWVFFSKMKLYMEGKEYVFKDIVLAIYDGKMEQSGMFQVILPMLEEMKVYRKQR